MMVNMNIPNIDLHCHSTISDGLLSPRSLVSFAAEKNVSVLALTDHDDIAGLEQAKKYEDELNIFFINVGSNVKTGDDVAIKLVSRHHDK